VTPSAALRAEDQTLVERFGLRLCPRGCRGACTLARQRREGDWIIYTPSPDCELMKGPAPRPKALEGRR
jgi:hypothetical protein